MADILLALAGRCFLFCLLFFVRMEGSSMADVLLAFAGRCFLFCLLFFRSDERFFNG